MMESSREEPRPSYSQTRERIVRVVPPHLICSLTCGGRECRYESPECWSVEQQAIRGLYSSWITEEILAMSRPSTRLIKEYNLTEQFHRFGICTVVNAQIPWEHGYCGDPLEPQSGFSYRPQDFMDCGICFYNFGLPDFGVVSVPRILDAVKVIAFASREGRVAVHCHAGLGRTGVLIACYLIYSCRVNAADAIRFVRLRRPGSIQTGSQVSVVYDFALFLSSQWPVFTQVPSGYPSFTLAQYLVCQRNLLHGQEARSLRHIPKPVVVICRRFAQLAGGRRARGPWVDLEREAAHRLLHQIIVRAASERQYKKMPTPVCETDDCEEERSGKKRRGLLQSQISCDTGILQLLLTDDSPATVAEVGTAGNGLHQPELVETAPSATKMSVPEDVHETASSNITNNLVNEEGAWAMISTESNPKILSALLWDWLQQLSDPVLNRQEINLFCDGNWRQNLRKLNRSQAETLCCLLQCVSKLTSLPCPLEEMVIIRLIRALTKQPPNMPDLPPEILLQLRCIVQEIRAHGIMSRAQRKPKNLAQNKKLNIENTTVMTS
ncbi:protein tyrosine phosphatase domain-containing protein 1-like isoform X2 [Hyperolius riggenbachi]|uniref:protein tyrosine phosphatase domain-containing protein 1-like isoform X2 n=1 Tax=Hyperolius riggenbachi TaxID=752182 RepID=UPI0035A3B724